MAQHLHVVEHLSSADLKQRYQSAHDPVERTHFHVLHLASERWRSADIAEVSSYSVVWVRKLVRRYNDGGPEALEDQRHRNPGQPRLLGTEQEAELERLLRGTPEDGGVWTGPKVAQWIRQTLGREVADVRGWEALRRLGYRPLRPRRRHAKADPQVQEAFPGGTAEAPSG
jgi:transposase